MSWLVLPVKEADLAAIQALVPAATTVRGVLLAHAWAGWDGEELVAIGGITDVWTGVGSAWFFAIPGRLTGKRVGHAVRTVRQMLAEAVTQRGLWRIHCAVRVDTPTDITFVEHFNFRREGLMRQYGPEGADYYMYAWVREGR